MALSLIVPGTDSLRAQNPAPTPADQTSSQQGGFVMKVNAELVLTNVVARDAKTGELSPGPQAERFLGI